VYRLLLLAALHFSKNAKVYVSAYLTYSKLLNMAMARSFFHLFLGAGDANKPFSDFISHSPLHNSVEKGHLEICRLLLRCNANPRARQTFW
jgi:hypothetical protein